MIWLALLGTVVDSSVAPASVAGEVVVHVAPDGDDAAAGTADQPLATPAAALRREPAAHRIVFHGGTYRLDRPIVVERSGTAARWLVLEAAPGEQPVFDFTAYRPAEGREASHRGGIEIQGPSHVRLSGLSVRNVHAFGVAVRGPSHHVDIVDCRVHETFGPGIGVWNASQIRVARNEVTGATTNRMRLYGDPRNEAPHEAISIAGVDGFEVVGNRVHHGEKEGIDVKEVSRNGVVHANWVHDMPRQGLYADAWFGHLHHVAFVGNVVERCEWGAVVSVEGRESRLSDVRFERNLIRDCRASGFFFGRWGGDGPRERVAFVHNTVLRCGKPDHWAGPTGGVDLRSPNSRDVEVRGNLILDCPTFGIAADVPPGPAAVERRIVIAGNWVDPHRPVPDVPAPYGALWAWPADPPGTKVSMDESGWRPVEPAAARAYGAFAGGANRLPKAESPLTGFPDLGPLRGMPVEIAP